MKTIGLSDGRELTYELTRKAVKNINFRIKPSGLIMVSAKNGVSVQYIEKLLTESADKIFAAIDRLRARDSRSDITEERVNWLGKEYPVRVINNFGERAAPDENEFRVFTAHGSDTQHVRYLLERSVAALFSRLCEELNGEVRAELSRSGLVPPPTVITIKDMKSRWGSCTYTKGHISINVRLAAYPRETVLSVLWHEYAHYWHHDHSKEFYAFVEKYYPEYHKWNGLLN